MVGLRGLPEGLKVASPELAKSGLDKVVGGVWGTGWTENKGIKDEKELPEGDRRVEIGLGVGRGRACMVWVCTVGFFGGDPDEEVVACSEKVGFGLVGKVAEQI